MRLYLTIAIIPTIESSERTAKPKSKGIAKVALPSVVMLSKSVSFVSLGLLRGWKNWIRNDDETAKESRLMKTRVMFTLCNFGCKYTSHNN